jgi:hypothetical protein
LTQRVAFSGIGRWPPVDDQDFIEPRRVHRDREQALAFGVGFDVERQHARRDCHVGWSQHWIVEGPGHAASGGRVAFDLATALDAAFDQIAHGEAHIGFERIDTGRMQAVAERRNVRRYIDLDTCDRLACKRPIVDGSPFRHPHGVRTLRVDGTHVEMRQLTIVAYQEGAAVCQSPVDVYDGDARAIRSIRDPIARLQNEAARSCSLIALCHCS